MSHDVSLIAIIAVGFVLATICGYIADRIHLPALVGYLMAGVIIGPFTPGFVADVSIAGQLAEMGIILLMFGVGLHFSASDLLAVRGVAIPGALIGIVIMTGLGTGLGTLWGWPVGHAIVFGLCISIASTVVLLKALEERNLMETPTGRVAVGWLITEDLAMVLVLVLLPAFAGMLGGHIEDPAHSGDGGGSIAWQLAITLAKVGAFGAIAAIVGPRVVPSILTHVARTGSRELFTLAVLAIAVGIAFGSAAAFGVSFALGAFFAGVIMGESPLSARAAENSLPLQDAFSVLFFVSIGMLFDPSILIREPMKVLAVLFVIIAGKTLVATTVVLVLRFPVGLALGMGSSLSQIGEFSFILAGLCVSYGLMDKEGQDLILAGSILSITLNPLVLMGGQALKKWVYATWPDTVAGIGKPKLKGLVQELDRIRALGEKRHEEQEQRITQFLETFPLFSSIDKHAQEELLLLFNPRTASPGERVVREGERGDAMYFIASGSAEVDIKGKAIRLGPGAYFGEMALLSGGRRTADVTAIDFCRFLVLTRRDFNQFMAHHPELRSAFFEVADKRKAQNAAQGAVIEPDIETEET